LLHDEPSCFSRQRSCLPASVSLGTTLLVTWSNDVCWYRELSPLPLLSLPAC
jgi:hypothetical protein